MKSPYEISLEQEDITGGELDRLLQTTTESISIIVDDSYVSDRAFSLLSGSDTYLSALESSDLTTLTIVDISVNHILEQFGMTDDGSLSITEESIGDKLKTMYALAIGTVKAIIDTIIRFLKTFGLDADKIVMASKGLKDKLSDINTASAGTSKEFNKRIEKSPFYTFDMLPKDAIRDGLDGYAIINTMAKDIDSYLDVGDVVNNIKIDTAGYYGSSPSLSSNGSSYIYTRKYYKGQVLGYVKEGNPEKFRLGTASSVVAKNKSNFTPMEPSTMIPMLIDGLTAMEGFSSSLLDKTIYSFNVVTEMMNTYANFNDSNDKKDVDFRKNLTEVARALQLLVIFYIKAILGPMKETVVLSNLAVEVFGKK